MKVMHQLRHKVFNDNEYFNISLRKIPINVFRNTDDYTPFLIMFSLFDIKPCTLEQCLDIISFLEFLGFDEKNISINTF